MRYEGYEPRTQRGYYGNLFLWVLGILAIIGVVSVIVFAVRWATAPAKGKLQARTQIQSGSFRIAAYEAFFNECASIQGLEGQIDAQLEALKSATGDDKARIEANIAGQRGARASAIAQYNADARKNYTVGQFRSSDLPYQLSTDPYNGENKTQCTA